MLANYLIATEQHARQFLSPAIIDESPTLYIAGGARKQAIDKVIDRYRDQLKIPVFKNINQIFTDILDPANRGKQFVLSLHCGKGNSHQEFYNYPKFREYLDTPLKEVPSTVLIMNELLFYPIEGYVPHAHGVLARSQVEFELLSKQVSEETIVSLVGDLGLDGYSPSYSSNLKTLLFLTSLDPSRYTSAYPVLDRMMKDLKKYTEENKLEALYLKQHPGACRSNYIPSITSFCEKRGIKYQEIDKRKDLSSLPHVDFALVQGSFSSHLNLRKAGIESRYYYSPAERNWDSDFFNLACLPESALSCENYSSEEYDNWVKKTFLLDGDTVKRFRQACVLARDNKNE